MFLESINNIIDKSIKFLDKFEPTFSKLDEFLSKFDKLAVAFFTMIEKVGKMFIILKNDENLYEFGKKYTQAYENDIKRDDYESFDDFNQAIIDAEIVVEPPKNDEERIAYERLGSMFLKEELDKKLGVNIPETVYLAASNVDTEIQKENIEKVADYIKETGLDNEKLEKFDQNQLTFEDKNFVKENIVEIYKIFNPNISEKEALDKYYSLLEEINYEK